MRMLCIVTILVLIASAAYARDVFEDKELKEIQVVEITAEGASIRSSDGTVQEVAIGDYIGTEAGEVVEIGPNSITIQIDRTMIKMPVMPGGFQAN